MAKRVHLLEVDPELGAGLSDLARRSAEEELRVRVAPVPRGPWRPPTRQPGAGALGLLILDGLMVREVDVLGSRAIEPLGRGDLIRPWQEDATSFCRSRWSALRRAELGVLDSAFTRSLARWPTLIPSLVDRAVRRSRWLAAEAATSNIVGVEKRVLMALWQLAERWGQVEAGNVVIPVRLTHQMLAEVVGARRPSVSQALGELAEAGELERLPNGRWALLRSPPQVVEETGEPELARPIESR